MRFEQGELIFTERERDLTNFPPRLSLEFAIDASETAQAICGKCAQAKLFAEGQLESIPIKYRTEEDHAKARAAREAYRDAKALYEDIMRVVLSNS